MALTGGVLFVFVIGHLVGNLQMFFGTGDAQSLRALPAIEQGNPLAGAVGIASVCGPAHRGGGAPLGGEQSGAARALRA